VSRPRLETANVRQHGGFMDNGADKTRIEPPCREGRAYKMSLVTEE